MTLKASDQAISEKPLLEQAHSHISNKDWDQVVNILNASWHANNLSEEGLELLAFAFSRLKQFEKAIQIFTELCADNPSNERLLYYLGYQYQAKGTWAAAADAYRKCLEINPRWLNVSLKLGEVLEQVGDMAGALDIYRHAFKIYKKSGLSHQNGLKATYSKICQRAAKLILADNGLDAVEKAEFLFRECVAAEPLDADNWYRLGALLLKRGDSQQALEYLQKAKTLAPNKEYITHKLAQTLATNDDFEGSLRLYETIPHHKRAPYILHGIANCLVKKGDFKEAASYLFMAARKEPDKFYHHWDFALALVQLGDIGQAIEELTKVNELFLQENQRDYQKAIAKIKELEALPKGEKIVFQDSQLPVTEISFGMVVAYNNDRGFGFLQDNGDQAKVFFHITRVGGNQEPQKGMRAKFIRELGEKGPQATKVWLLKN